MCFRFAKSLGSLLRKRASREYRVATNRCACGQLLIDTAYRKAISIHL